MNSLAAPMIGRGLLAILVGVIVVGWPGITVGAFVILFAVYAFLAAGTEVMCAFRSETAVPVARRLMLSLIDIAAGVVALAWPGLTAYVLAVLIAVWAFIIGFFEFFRAFSIGETAGERVLLGSTGLVSGALGLALGLVLAVQPDAGADTIAQVFGIFSIVAGISSLVIGANLRGATPSPAGG